MNDPRERLVRGDWNAICDRCGFKFKASELKKTWDNLYVCDCSVIPEAWGLPPTMTLVGLGKRLAKHLAA